MTASLPKPRRAAAAEARSPLPRIPVRELSLSGTYRLIPARSSAGGTVLSRLTADAAVLEHLMELDDATNERFLGEGGQLPGVSLEELVHDSRYAHIVNAAFTHAAPAGARFNSRRRGAWYASLDRETALVEVAYFKLRHLHEVAWPEVEIAVFDTYLADITAPMHDLRPPSPERPLAPQFRRFLEPGPFPGCYAASQQLAEALLARRANGILYPSVRRTGGECLVCFRPALVGNVRRSARLELPLRAGQPFQPHQTRELPPPEL